jgi:hypothetical protein
MCDERTSRRCVSNQDFVRMDITGCVLSLHGMTTSLDTSIRDYD